jgi:hypothetical protein
LLIIKNPFDYLAMLALSAATFIFGENDINKNADMTDLS